MLPTTQDPALTKPTFSNNKPLHDALARIAARHSTTPAPVISGAEVDGTDASPEPPPMKFNPLIQPAQVEIMSLSANTIRAALKYVGIVNRYENPETYFNSGLTAREMELVRTKAHNDLIEQLRAEGIRVDDRASTTELAQRIDTWMREE